MKILETNLKKGIVKVLPEDLDDLWHLYNIISIGDRVYAYTSREVKPEGEYARPKGGERIRVFLGVKVEKVSWDKSLNRLRVLGRICEAPEDLNITGFHHTLNILPNRPLTIEKDRWLKHEIDRLKRASKPRVKPIIVVAIDDEEYCIAILRQYGIEVKVEERTRIPGKLEAEKREKAFKEFFKSALSSLKSLWMESHYPIVVIGPGFVKNNFVKYVKNVASDVGKAIIDVKSVNSGGLAGINEALRSGVLTKALKHVRIAEEAMLVEDVLTRLGRGERNVTYGFSEVEKAGSYGAIDKILIVDVVIREAPDEKRLILERVMKETEDRGGEVFIISAEHEAGEKLLALGGIAALLRFPIE